MRKDLDILLLTETQVNTSNVGTHGNFIVFFSSDIQPRKSDREHAGAGIVIHKKLKPFVYEVKQTNGRMMAIRLKSHGINLQLKSKNPLLSHYSICSMNSKL